VLLAIPRWGGLNPYGKKRRLTSLFTPVEQGQHRCHVIWMPCLVKKMKQFLKKTALWILAIPLALSLMGAASNQLVLIVNHDKFPVEVNTLKEEVMVYKMESDWKAATAEAGVDLPVPEGMIDDVHCVMTHDTHLNYLADIFDLHDGIYSIGDFGLRLGEWLMTFAPFVWAFEVINRLRKKED